VPTTAQKSNIRFYSFIPENYLLKFILINGLFSLFDFFRKLIEPALQLVRIVVQGVCDVIENIGLVGVITQHFNELQALI
jgi:hypothetical protein